MKGDDPRAFRYSMKRKRICRYIDERQLAIDCAVEEATEDALAVGRKQGKLEDAKTMLARGYSTAEVIEITKLSRKQIKAIRIA